jgi:putative ABC transport system substrate-binding protein
VIKRHFLWFLTLLLLCGGSAHAHKVWVLTGDSSANYVDTTQAVSQALVDGGVDQQDVLVQSFRELEGRLSALEQPKLIISLGSDALAAALKWNLRSAVLAGVIPRAAFERISKDSLRRSNGSLSAVYLDQPISRQIESLKIALPRARKVGVVFGPNSQTQQAAYAAALRTRQLEMVSAVVSPENSVFSALKASLDGVDVLLAVSDPAVFNSTTLSNILLTTYAAQVPVVAFSPAYVKAGALYALYSKGPQIGKQLGAVALGYLQSGQLPAALHPFEYSIDVNDSVARSLGISLDITRMNEMHIKTEQRP